MRAGISSENSSSRSSGIECDRALASHESFVCAVAEGRRAGLLACAEESALRFRGGVFHRREARALVAAVAERLLRGLAADAPPVILSRLDLDRYRRPARNHRLFAHSPL